MDTLNELSRTLQQIIDVAPVANEAMRKAGIELDRRQVVIDQYRDKVADYETFVGKLYGLLTAEKFDDARDLVRYVYSSIHGPDA